jgi:hypothetical protein
MSEATRTAGADRTGEASDAPGVAAKVAAAPVENTHDG